MLSKSIQYPKSLPLFIALLWLGVELGSSFFNLSPFFLNFWLVVVTTGFIAKGNLLLPLQLAFRHFKSWKSLSLPEKFLSGLILFFLLVTFLQGVGVPPNNWDSLTYHLSRIGFWLQNGSVEFYVTQNDRQLYQPPLAEYLVTYTFTLFGSDRFAFLVQWLALGNALFFASLITAKLGGNRAQKLVAMGLTASLPMALLQAPSTQNDLLLGSFLLVLVYHLLEALESPNSLIFAGLTAGLAFLSKGTSALFIGALGLTFIAFFVKRLNLKHIIAIAFGGILFVSLNYFHLKRNYETFGHLSGTTPEVQASYANQTHSLADFSSVFVRNIGIHIASLDPGISNAYESFANSFIHLVGKENNDPNTTFGAIPLDFDAHINEDYTGNFFAFILVLVALGVSLRSKIRSLNVKSLWLGSGILIFFLAFCYIFKYQPWHARLHLPMFVLAMPLVAKSLGNKLWQPKWNVLCLLLVASGGYWMLFNSMHKLWPPGLSFFVQKDYEVKYAAQPELGLQLDEAIEHIPKSTKKLGLLIDGDTWDYPLFRKFDRHQSKVEHIAVDNITNKLKTDFQPEVILVDKRGNDDSLIIYQGVSFRRSFKNEYFKVYTLNP